MIPNVLSIAGSDPSGGAGIQADLKTFSALGCYGMAAITALTAQNTRGVSGVHVPPAAFVADQIEAIFTDVTVAAVKIGMLANAEIVMAVAECLARHNPPAIVLDPVLVATSGDSLGAPGVVDAMRMHLFPLATLITPNIPEAARLADMSEATDLAGLEGLASRLHELGARAVLVKGGHLTGETAEDVLFDGEALTHYSAPRIDTRNTHGTGCTLSSAIAAHLARGMSLPEAIRASKAYLTAALEASDVLNVGDGQGHGPVHHFRWLWT
ncbi:MAG: bifunctional hydroxymethylpyrimidine kinase/phosphomethylpyrimidine kinase [Beijerinckiaceae bacterium]|nr:bifunctional hydroxymethylpyrimidine kinase/phosphomethylpyrimidine kinase [Beijerinckiaceae bacterium]